MLENRALGPKVYRAENCNLVKNLSGQHTQSVLAMEHCYREKSPVKKDEGDFSLLVTAGGDCRLEFWDAITYNSQFSVPTGKEHVSCLRWYGPPGLERLYSGSRDIRFGPSRDQHGGFINHWAPREGEGIHEMRREILGEKKIHELMEKVSKRPAPSA